MNLNMLTIKQKILLTVSLAVILSTVAVGLLGQHSARDVVEQRMLGSEMPAKMLSIRNELEKDMVSLLNAAKQLDRKSVV